VPRPFRRPLLIGLLCLACAGGLRADAAPVPGGPPPVDARIQARDPLVLCARQAVERLARPGGFALDPDLRIGMPPALLPAEKLLRRLGGRGEVESFLAALNQHAEALAAKAEPLLLAALRDGRPDPPPSPGAPARNPDSAAPLCQVFRRDHEADLLARLQVLARLQTDGELVDRVYRRVVKQSVRFGYVRGEAPALDRYLAQQTLQGLFLAMAEAEKSLYAGPASPLVTAAPPGAR